MNNYSGSGPSSFFLFFFFYKNSNYKNLPTGAYTPIRHLSLRSLLPDTEHYMTYEGSTTHPGCWETAVWVILNKPIYITKQEVRNVTILMEIFSFRQMIRCDEQKNKN